MKNSAHSDFKKTEAEEQLWPINTVPQQISHCMLKGRQLNGCINIF